MNRQHCPPATRNGLLQLCLLSSIALVVGCSSESAGVMHLQDYGTKVEKSEHGIDIDLRNAPDFDDGAIELVAAHGEEVFDLTLQNVGISDAGLAKLQSLSKVNRLILNENDLSGEALKQLSQLPLRDSLTNIGLKHADIDDDDLSTLKSLPNLSRIDLTGTNVSDQGLKEFQGDKWSMINLTDTDVTKAGIDELRSRYPKADIRF